MSETLERVIIGILPCFVCGDDVEVKETARGKLRPYFNCECGVQFFARGNKSDAFIRNKVRSKKIEPAAVVVPVEVEEIETQSNKKGGGWFGVD